MLIPPTSLLRRSLSAKLAYLSQRERLPLTFMAVFACLLAIGLGLFYSGGFQALDARVTNPVEFQVRELFKLSPAFAKQLRIFSLDDDSFAKLHAPGLSGKHWAAVIRALAKAKPKAIVTTHMFGTSEFDASGELAAAIDDARSNGIKVVAGVVASPRRMRFRQEVDLDDVALPASPAWAQLHLPDQHSWVLYGPDRDQVGHFSALGHQGYDVDGQAALFLRLSQGRIVPHLSLAVADELQWDAGSLQVDGRSFRLADDGRVRINFVRYQDFARQTKSLDALLTDARAGAKARYVNAGDTVLLLMDMHIGKVNFIPTPNGLKPAGYAVASLLNSTLTGQWLEAQPLTAGAVVMAALLGSLASLAAEGWVLIGLVSILPLVFVAACLGAFAAFSLSLPWLPLTSLYAAAACSQYIIRARSRLAAARARQVDNDKETARLGAIVRTAQMFAHDVRKPFSILAMAQKALELEKDPRRIKPLLDKLGPELARAVASVEGMIRDIMEIDGQTKLFLENVDLQQQLQISLAQVLALKPDYAHTNIRRTSFAHTLPVAIDAARMQRVFANIIENALQAMGRDGELWVDTSDAVEGGIQGVHICLGNSGSLIPPDKIKHVFEAFYTDGKRNGTGLGLAIAHKIVTAHGGRIWACSSAAHGTEFWLFLRALRVAASPAPQPPPPPLAGTDQRQVPPAPGAVAPRRLAVVEDNIFVAESWQMIAADAEVLTFASPAAFLARAQQEPGFIASLAVVVSDFHFDDSADDGLSFARQLRARAPHLPIFLSSDGDVQPGAGDGLTGVIAKEPVRLAFLLDLALAAAMGTPKRFAS